MDGDINADTQGENQVLSSDIPGRLDNAGVPFQSYQVLHKDSELQGYPQQLHNPDVVHQQQSSAPVPCQELNEAKVSSQEALTRMTPHESAIIPPVPANLSDLAQEIGAMDAPLVQEISDMRVQITDVRYKQVDGTGVYEFQERNIIGDGGGNVVANIEDEEMHNDPVETHNNPVAMHNNLVGTQNAPVETHIDPVETHNDPVETHNDPVEMHTDSMEMHNDPVETHNDLMKDYHSHTLPEPISSRSTTTSDTPEITMVNTPTEMQVSNIDNIATPQSTIVVTITEAPVSNIDNEATPWCNFKCKLCPKSFQDRTSWKFHTMDDHGLLPYACRYCDDRYEHKSDLKGHERSHRSRNKVNKTIDLENRNIAQENFCVKEVTVSKEGEEILDKPSQQSALQDSVTDSVGIKKATTQSVIDVKTEKRNMRPRRPKVPVRTSTTVSKRKKNVVVVSVLDVMKSDAEKLQQHQQKGGASRALLSIVDQIRTTTGFNKKDSTKDIKRKLQLSASRQGDLMEVEHSDEDDDVGDEDYDDDKDESYSISATYSKIKRKKHRVKGSKKAYVKGGKIHKCKICSRVLSSNKVKIYHERGHPYPNECRVCHRALQSKLDVRDHEEGHRNGRWTCRLCSDVFKDCQSYDNHRKVHLQEEKNCQEFKCQFCVKIMRSKKSLEVHNRVHTGEKPYKCSYCEKSYRHYESWNYHENKHKGTLKQHVCQFCGKAFGGKYGLQVHERIHTGEKPYKCDHCSLTFSSNEKLKVHKDKINGLAFVCQFCGKEFFTKPNLNQHEMIHKGVKPHECKTCEASFTSSTSLKYHNRTVHTGERYPCLICNKQCKSKGQLTSHMRSHTDERPFKCKYCHKSFRNSNTLKTHEQGIHLGYRYTCEICKKDFSQKTALRTHDKLVHQGIKWKDLVQQRKVNRERRLADDVKGKGSEVDKLTQDTTLPVPVPGKGILQAALEQESFQQMDPALHQDIVPQVHPRQVSKMYQHRMIYHQMGNQDHANMNPHLQPRLPTHHNLTIPTSLPPMPIPISVSSTMSAVPVGGNDPSVPDVAYQLATLATSTRHLYVRQTQGHPEEAVQVHVPGVSPSDSSVVDVVFPSDGGTPMYQTL